MEMKRLITICLVGSFILAMITRTAGATCVGYTVQSNGDDNLYSIDLTTGAYTRIGPVGYSDVEGLGFSLDGTLYGVEGTEGHVITIDITTGQGTLVGTCNLSGIDTGAAVDLETGTIYAFSSSYSYGYLYTISKDDGSETLLRSYPNLPGDSLAIGPGSIAYVADTFSTDALYSIKLVSPYDAFQVGSLGLGGGDLAGMARCPLTNMYYLLLEDGYLYTVDTATGHASLLSSTISGCEGFAIIPEPATICLLGFGALSLIHRKRRV
jgi:hypothetical protein